MIVTTLYTDSHEVMFRDWFSRTLRLNGGDLLVARKVLHGGGKYGSGGFNDLMVLKMLHCQEMCHLFPGELVLFADADVAFYSDHLSVECEAAIEGLDMAFQHDGAGSCCAGLFLYRAVPEVERLLGVVANLTPKYMHDQQAMNHVLTETSYANTVRSGLLPDGFWSAGAAKQKTWPDNRDEIELPNVLIAHHANWTLGVPNKLTLLNHVRTLFESRRMQVLAKP